MTRPRAALTIRRRPLEENRRGVRKVRSQLKMEQLHRRVCPHSQGVHATAGKGVLLVAVHCNKSGVAPAAALALAFAFARLVGLAYPQSALSTALVRP